MLANVIKWTGRLVSLVLVSSQPLGGQCVFFIGQLKSASNLFKAKFDKISIFQGMIDNLEMGRCWIDGYP